MPSFPTSPHTFASFSNGALSDAAQVTDIYGEVEAVEAGYLNGTARLNSSNSTHTNLSVTGGSTFATRPVMPPDNSVRLSLTGAVELTNGVAVTVNWAVSDYSYNSSLFSGGASSLVTPQSTGLWNATAQINFSPNSSGVRSVLLLTDSGFVIARAQCAAASPGGAEPIIINITGTRRVASVGDAIKVQAYQAGASTTSAVVVDSWFEVRKY